MAQKEKGHLFFQTWTQHCPLRPHWDNTVDLSELPRNEPVIGIDVRWRVGERSCKLNSKANQE